MIEAPLTPPLRGIRCLNCRDTVAVALYPHECFITLQVELTGDPPEERLFANSTGDIWGPRTASTFSWAPMCGPCGERMVDDWEESSGKGLAVDQLRAMILPISEQLAHEANRYIRIMGRTGRDGDGDEGPLQ